MDYKISKRKPACMCMLNNNR